MLVVQEVLILAWNHVPARKNGRGENEKSANLTVHSYSVVVIAWEKKVIASVRQNRLTLCYWKKIGNDLLA